MRSGRTVRGALSGEMDGRPAEAVRARAFQALAEGHLEDCYGLAYAILADPTEARDAVHDAFVRAWQHFGSLRDPASFEPWFKAIVVNACRNRLRSRSRRQTTDLAAHPGLPAPDAIRAVDDRLLVEQAIGHLGPDDQVLLALRYYRDLRVEDIAVLLEVPPGTVSSRLSRAHERLRASLDRSGPRGAAR
jgi:RNA polymerase sigma-70 factor, ECF subfamily